MPPPIYSFFKTVTTVIEVPARICNPKDPKRGVWWRDNHGRGFHKVSLPTGKYEIKEVARDMNYYHEIENSDGYTYRIMAKDKDNPFYDKVEYQSGKKTSTLL